jgi:acyl-[acyl-carrier-protein]-phospholipid O-acyltransferase / long-chain-fatty-acid--[acyl-carrier-protein] ligase
VIRDGWYVTGDMARIDASGFITITGRQSRFSKIGGEMVPHLLIEEEIEKLVGGDHQELCVAVSAVPDERKGERLIVLHTALLKNVDEITAGLKAKGLPNLWIPGNDSYFAIDAIPVLGTGKLDLQAIKRLAAEKAGTGK